MSLLVALPILAVSAVVIVWSMVTAPTPARRPVHQHRRPRTAPDPLGGPTVGAAVIPAPAPPQVTLDRYRARVVDAEARAHDLEIELAEARRALDAVARELRLHPPADRLVLWLDCRGGNVDLGEVARALGVDRDEAERRVHRLAEARQPIELERGRVRLRLVS